MAKNLPTTAARKAQREALAAIAENQALDQRFQRIQKKRTDADTHDVLSRHGIGAEILQIVGDTAKYGDNAISLIASGMGVSEAELYNYRNLARAWSREELDDLLAKARHRQFSLGFTHLSYLASLPPTDMKSMAGKCLAELMTTRELWAAIQALRGPRGGSHGGREMVPPKTPHAGLSQMVKITQEIANREPLLMEGVFEKMDQLAPTEWSSDLLKELTKADKSLEDSGVALNRLQKRLQRMLEHGQQVLAARRKPQPETPKAPPVTETAKLIQRRKAAKAAKTKGPTAPADDEPEINWAAGPKKRKAALAAVRRAKQLART